MAGKGEAMSATVVAVCINRGIDERKTPVGSVDIKEGPKGPHYKGMNWPHRALVPQG